VRPGGYIEENREEAVLGGDGSGFEAKEGQEALLTGTRWGGGGVVHHGLENAGDAGAGVY